MFQKIVFSNAYKIVLKIAFFSSPPFPFTMRNRRLLICKAGDKNKFRCGSIKTHGSFTNGTESL